LRKLKLFHSLIAYFATKSSRRETPLFPASQALSTPPQGPLRAADNWVALLQICLVCAVVSYLCGSLLYPGGSYHDRRALGYDHVHNYLCDLWATRPHGHNQNPARPLGIATVCFLSASLAPLSLIIRNLITSPRAQAVPLLLMAGTLSGALVFTPLHDLAIEVGFIPTTVGFLLSLFALGQSGYLRLAWLGLWPLCAGSLNFTLWIMGWALFAAPVVQKLALLGLTVWALLIGWVSRTLGQDAGRP